jgi:hypothetical protein
MPRRTKKGARRPAACNNGDGHNGLLFPKSAFAKLVRLL